MNNLYGDDAVVRMKCLRVIYLKTNIAFVYLLVRVYCFHDKLYETLTSIQNNKPRKCETVWKYVPQQERLMEVYICFFHSRHFSPIHFLVFAL